MFPAARRTAALLALLVTSAVLTAAPSLAAPAAGPAGQLAGLNMETVTIPQLEYAMDTGQLTSSALTAFYLDRIGRVDPLVNAIIAVNGGAALDAASSDRIRRQSGARGPLEGIPVLLKDNIDTANQPTTAGSEALLLARPDDAALVARLRDAGAIILGKTNLSEWANFRSSNSSSGWSGVGGQTNNPYVLDRNPCGSSSGSAVGVASSLSVVAIGTETDGSIVCPAGQNGVVGIKPTLGLVSGDGVVPISSRQDTAGPIARNVTDAAIVLGVLSGHQAQYGAALRPGALQGARIGVWSSVTGDTSPDVDALFAQTVTRLQQLGATTVTVTPPYQNVFGTAEFPALLTEFAHDVNAYLDNTPGPHPADLAGLIDFNAAHASTELQYFGQDIFIQAQATRGDLTDPTYQQERRTATTFAQRSIDQTLAAYHLDAIVAPTNSPAWVTTLGQGDAFKFGSSGPAAVAGYPNVTVPMGYIGPLPIGMSMFAGAYAEPRLLALAFSFEQATMVRHPPTYLQTLPG